MLLFIKTAGESLTSETANAAISVKDSMYQAYESRILPREGPEVRLETWGYLSTVAAGLSSYILMHCSLNDLHVAHVRLGVLGYHSMWHRHSYEQCSHGAESAGVSIAQLWGCGYLHLDSK